LNTQPDIIPEGLPGHLPEGERLLWQGRPDWQRLAINAFHIRKIAIYFATLIVAQGVWKVVNGAGIAEALQAVPLIAGLGLTACAILAGFAYASARTTHYTLTNKRALMKVGIALPVIINLPLRQIDGVSFAHTGKGCGTICFKTGGGTRLAYLLLWPHAKPWNVTKTQPAFRDIADVEAVASRLAFAMGGHMPVVESKFELAHGHMVPAE
jgi:Bacterial PH domain